MCQKYIILKSYIKLDSYNEQAGISHNSEAFKVERFRDFFRRIPESGYIEIRSRFGKKDFSGKKWANTLALNLDIQSTELSYCPIVELSRLNQCLVFSVDSAGGFTSGRLSNSLRWSSEILIFASRCMRSSRALFCPTRILLSVAVGFCS